MMPIISMFFGIVVRMYADDHNPPHVYVEYQGNKAVYSLDGVALRRVTQETASAVRRLGHFA